MRQALLPAVTLLALLGRGPLRAAEEAVRTDGRRITGKLVLESGRLRFRPAGQTEPVPIDEVREVRFPSARPPVFRAAGVYRARLWDGQQITGQLLSLDDKVLALRTAWSERLPVPRAAVAALTPLPGYRTVFEDDLTGGLKAWAVAGKPGGAALDTPGQSLTYTPPDPVAAGRVGVNFQERGRPAGAAWALDVVFQTATGTRTLTVTVAGAGADYEVDPGGLDGVSRRVPRSPGPHRLAVRFTPRSLRVTCDDAVLWYTLKQGPGGPLRKVRLACRKSAPPARPRGSVAWSEFSLERAVAEPRHPPGDAKQDEVWLENAGQLFGRISRADRRGVRIVGRFGQLTFPWSEVNGCFFRRVDSPKPPEGARVRVFLYSGLAADADVLDGVVKALDDRRLTLRHVAGEIRLDRSLLRRLRPRPEGRRPGGGCQGPDDGLP